MARAPCGSPLTEYEATTILAQVCPRSRRKNSGKPTPPSLIITLALLLFSARVAEALLPMTGALHAPETAVVDLGRALNRAAKLRRESLLVLASKGGRHDIPALSPPVLELITPDGWASSSETSPLIRSVDRAVTGGVSLVQLRDYESDAKSKAELANRLAATTEGRAWFVINGEPETARECCADGVHLPERMVDRLVDLRTKGEWPRIVGCSVHSVAAALKAARMGADYVQVGTMFPTKSHPGKEPEGVGMLNDVRRELDAEGFVGVLVIGVGGIDASNADKVAAAGGDGVAAISCLCKAEDAEGEARQIMDALRTNAVPARGRA